jgi:Calcineurin-like phosphoesterase
MFSLIDHVKTYDAMLVVGDIHSDYESFAAALDFATKENYFFMCLGDLVDRGPEPFKVVEAMYKRMYDGHAGFVIGNHDNKFYRYANGADVKFSRDAKQTFVDVGEDRKEEFLRMYCDIVSMPVLSGPFHRFEDIILVHAAAHHSLWDGTEPSKKAQSRFLVGETNNEYYPDGYPVRLYNWIDEIPMGKTIMVGHDKQPIHNVPITEPMIVSNKDGGKAIFMDTGCGKGGFLTGAVISHGKKGFQIQEYKEFK